MFLDPRHLFALNLGCIGLGTVPCWFATGSATLGIAAGALLSLGPRALYARLRKRLMRRFGGRGRD